MKGRLPVLLAFLLMAASACSDDDDGMDDPCLNACNKLSVCGIGVACSGVEIPVDSCTRFCTQKQAFGAANCVIQVPSCSQLDSLRSCGMPCS